MTDLDIAELRELAENATPGPWEGYKPKASNGYCYVDTPDRYGQGDISLYGKTALEDAKYVAALNPQVALALLDRLERAEAELALLQQPDQYHKRQSARAWNAIVERADRAEAAIERARALCSEVFSDILSDDFDITNWQRYENSFPVELLAALGTEDE